MCLGQSFFLNPIQNLLCFLSPRSSLFLEIPQPSSSQIWPLLSSVLLLGLWFIWFFLHSPGFHFCTSLPVVLCLDAQSCPTLCDPMLSSPPGSSVHGILRHESWSGLLCPPPGDLPNPGIKPRSPTLQADSLQGVSMRKTYSVIVTYKQCPVTFIKKLFLSLSLVTGKNYYTKVKINFQNTNLSSSVYYHS